MKPLAIDLFCGLGGWTAGLLATGWHVCGVDIERHAYGDQRYPGSLWLQDVLTLHGSQFAEAGLIVASPPCQEFSWMAMPWSSAKQVARALRGQDEFPTNYKGSRTVEDLNRLFNACFRIQREACEAAGRHIPMVVENVRGAIPWVGRSRFSVGSYHFWGDVPALMPITQAVKVASDSGRRTDPGLGARFTSRDCGIESLGHIKLGGSWFYGYRKGQSPRNHGSGSTKRKQASAEIAKIPFQISSWVAQCFKPI